MKRFRPFRKDQPTRDSFADVTLSAHDFIYPYFIVDGHDTVQPIPAMPGINRYSIDHLVTDVLAVRQLGIDKVLLFGVVSDEMKDQQGTAAYSKDNLVSRAVQAIKQSSPDTIVFTDVCLCGYTTHGHCGLLHNHDVDNDSTLPLLAEMALQHAKAGADFVAPSAMMDGQVEAIRQRLTQAGLHTRILAYSAKYASAFYGPFRDAAHSAPSVGDRRTYQMDYRTRNQGLEEIEADLAEGADWTMVKPALPYLDIISRSAALFPRVPVVAYQVSGEYAMLKAAAQAGRLDEEQAVRESLTAIKRAGAQYIITYYAKEYQQRWA